MIRASQGQCLMQSQGRPQQLRDDMRTMAQSVSEVLRVALRCERVACSCVHFCGDCAVSCCGECIGLGRMHKIPYPQVGGMDGRFRERIRLIHW